MAKKIFDDVKEILSSRSYAVMQIWKKLF